MLRAIKTEPANTSTIRRKVCNKNDLLNMYQPVHEDTRNRPKTLDAAGWPCAFVSLLYISAVWFGACQAQGVPEDVLNLCGDVLNISRDTQNIFEDAQNVSRDALNRDEDVQNISKDALNLSEDVFFRSLDVQNLPQDVKNVLFEVKNVAEDLKNVSFEVISLLLDVLRSSRRLVDGVLKINVKSPQIKVAGD
jgi:hypothetical protein